MSFKKVENDAEFKRVYESIRKVIILSQEEIRKICETEPISVNKELTSEEAMEDAEEKSNKALELSMLKEKLEKAEQSRLAGEPTISVEEAKEMINKKIAQHETGYFAQEILNDLIDKDLSGEELKEEFVRMNKAVRPAVKRLIEDAEAFAQENSKDYADKTDEIFGVIEE